MFLYDDGRVSDHFSKKGTEARRTSPDKLRGLAIHDISGCPNIGDRFDSKIFVDHDVSFLIQEILWNEFGVWYYANSWKVEICDELLAAGQCEFGLAVVSWLGVGDLDLRDDLDVELLQFILCGCDNLWRDIVTEDLLCRSNLACN